MLLYKREVQNSPRADMHTGLQMLFLDVSCLTLLIQQLGELTKNSLEIRENRVRIREKKISLEIRGKKYRWKFVRKKYRWKFVRTAVLGSQPVTISEVLDG